MSRIKTHYSEDEYGVAIEERFPRLSVWTLLKLEKLLDVRYFHAGVQALYQANDLQRVIDWLSKAKEEGRLIRRNGFLVAPELVDEKES